MTYSPPRPVDLTEEEVALWAQVEPHAERGSAMPDRWDEVADALEALTTSLLDRNAIPEIRLDLFTDPDLAEVRSRSPEQIFESNGTCGRAILRHPHFLPYLRHLILGPDLPERAIKGLCHILNEDAGTSGMIMDQYQRHVRACIRRFGLDRRHAATEFFRLGIEIGMDKGDAGVLRKAAMSAR